MFNTKTTQDLVKEFIASLPPGLKSLSQELQVHLSQCLQNFFNKMDLVTREEFDIQTQVLAKTRLQLTRLEKEIKELEEKLIQQ